MHACIRAPVQDGKYLGTLGPLYLTVLFAISTYYTSVVAIGTPAAIHLLACSTLLLYTTTDMTVYWRLHVESVHPIPSADLTRQ